MELLLATRNAQKTRELAKLLGGEFMISDLSNDASPAIEETGRTFAENAILKAIGAAQDRQVLVAADDSGLEVDSLGGAPGIFSARYAGANATDQQNIDRLLGELARRNVPADQRAARFRCIIALAEKGELLGTFEGVVEGVIVDPPRGNHGFGYDPIFRPNSFDKTFGQLEDETKNKISHRALAARKLIAFLKIARPSG